MTPCRDSQARIMNYAPGSPCMSWYATFRGGGEGEQAEAETEEAN